MQRKTAFRMEKKTNKQEPKQTNGRIAFGCSPSIRNSIECCCCCLMHQRTQNNNNRNLWLEFERFICTATEKTMLATTSITIRRVCVCLFVCAYQCAPIYSMDMRKIVRPGLFPNNRFFNCLTSARQHRTSSSHHKWMNSQINFDFAQPKTEQVYFTDKLNGPWMDGVGMDTFWNANQEANEHQN